MGHGCTAVLRSRVGRPFSLLASGKATLTQASRAGAAALINGMAMKIASATNP
jgi:hypothetical protein